MHTHLLDLLDREVDLLSAVAARAPERQAALRRCFGEHAAAAPSLAATLRHLRLAKELRREELRSQGGDAGGRARGDRPRSRSMDAPLEGDGSARARRGDGRTPLAAPLSSSPPSPPRFRGAIHGSPEQYRRHASAAPLPAPLPYRRCRSMGDPIEDGSARGWHVGGRYPPAAPLSSSLLRPPSPPQRCRPKHGSPEQYGRHVVAATLPALPYQSSPTRQRRNSSTRSDRDSSLFRLIVTLQLCLVRLEEAHAILCEGSPRTNRRRETLKRSSMVLLVTLGIGGACFASSKYRTEVDYGRLLRVSGKATTAAAVTSFVRRRCRLLFMQARLAHSADAVEDWIFNWICLVNDNGPGNAGVQDGRLFTSRKSRQTVWHSNSSIRYQLIKRCMDLLYASVGKAVELTRGGDPDTATEEGRSSTLWMYVVASLAAPYYNLIGPATKSAQVISSSSSSVIQSAWGLVGLPSVKRASLEATRILKGAHIADRIEVCGVSCFVLSREPFPALASALRRFRRQAERGDARLGTIRERDPAAPPSRGGAAHAAGFPRRDVVLHLAGGGFFAHTVAGDLPYLLDWSRAGGGAVVLVPEYAVLPRHRFPTAADEVVRIYAALRGGEAAALLGFCPDRILVSGEGVGGNLAASLCVSMLAPREGGCAPLTSRRVSELTEDAPDDGSAEGGRASGCESGPREMEPPDALLMSCPAVNLTLRATPSRRDGARDPVLPGALFAAISDAYLGDVPRTEPRASPLFAPDDVLRRFPPTLVFTSSEDPLLDDAVAFNGRLRGLGVRSSLRAVHGLPHAFWALCTVGIPEAVAVQRECEQFIKNVFAVRQP